MIVLSVVMPAHNAATTLARAIASVRRQSVAGWELIIVDDGSTDETAEIAREWAAKDNRIKPVSQAQRGVSDARNWALQSALGSWVVFLDADDTIHSRHFELMLRRARRRDLPDVVCCGTRRLDRTGRRVGDYKVPALDQDALAVCVKGPPVMIHAALVRRDWVLRVGGFDTNLKTNEDWDLWLRLARAGAKFAVVRRLLAYYWQSEDSLSKDAAQMTQDFRTVLDRARYPDSRLAAGGADMPMGEADESRAISSLWNAVSAIAAGMGPQDALAAIASPFPIPWDMATAGGIAVDAVAAATGCPFHSVALRWPEFSANLVELLNRLEEREGRPGLAYLLIKAFERQAIRAAGFGGHVTLSRTMGVMLGPKSLMFGVTASEGIDSVVFRLPMARPARRFMFEGPIWNGVLSGKEVRCYFRHYLERMAWVLLRRPLRLAGPLIESAEAPAREAYKLARRVLGPIRRRLRERMAAPAPGLEDKAAMIATVASSGGAAAIVHAVYQDVAARVPAPAAKSHELVPEPYGAETDLHQAWDAFFQSSPDPWSYDTPYEQLKYNQTFEMIPPGPIGDALELACAEGRFTKRLADRCDRVLATDISITALDRAKERCREHSNISYEVLDFFNEDIAGQWDLITCCEVLYYLPDLVALETTGRRLQKALKPGGHLIHAHAFELADDPSRTGLDWETPFGGKVIAETFAKIPGLAHKHSLRTELYTIDLYERVEPDQVRPALVEETALLAPKLELRVLRCVVWNGAIKLRSEANKRMTHAVPVLMYHQVREDGPEALAPYRVSPAQLEHQLRFLRRRGFQSLSPADWDYNVRRGRPLRGRNVILSFDDAYLDFYETAWPIIARNGFTAHVFVPVDKIGGASDWDAEAGQPAPLMSWEQIVDLADEVTFGSHLATHRRADGLEAEALLREAVRSKVELERRLGIQIDTVAPPFGACNDLVREVLHQAGYRRVFGDGGGSAPLFGDAMRTPRIEIAGHDDIRTFAAKLGLQDEPPDAGDEPDGWR